MHNALRRTRVTGITSALKGARLHYDFYIYIILKYYWTLYLKFQNWKRRVNLNRQERPCSEKKEKKLKRFNYIRYNQNV